MFDLLETIVAPYTREEYAKCLLTRELVPKNPTLTHGCKIFFKDGGVAVVWLRKGWEEFYRGVPCHQPLEPQMVKWEKVYEAVAPSHSSQGGNQRHVHTAYSKAQEEHYRELGLGWGSKHDGIWEANGRELDQFDPKAGPFC